jgi:probable rRNA maturation factor
LPELDLAFTTQPDLPEALHEQAGVLADPDAGEARWHALFRCWLAELSDELPALLRAPSYSLGLSLVDDAAISELNRTWRHQDGPTDVLSFAAQDPDAGSPLAPFMEGLSTTAPPHDTGLEGDLELGDIVISLERASCQARHHEHCLPRELLFLASHGLLHLLGWDHPDDAQLALMLACQDRLLQAAKRADLA